MDNETTTPSTSNGISTTKADTDEPFRVLSNTLCGEYNSTFFDQTQSWDTFDPDVTSCFRRTVLIWIPCAFFWLFLPIRLKQIMQRKGQIGAVVPGGAGLLNISKTVAACFLVIIGCIDLALAIGGIGNPAGAVIIADVVDASLRHARGGVLTGNASAFDMAASRCTAASCFPLRVRPNATNTEYF